MRLPGDAVGCRRLWVTVLTLALADALTGKPDSLERHKADMWIRHAGKDFRLVCTLAGLNPELVRDRYVSGQIDRSQLHGKPGRKKAA